MAHETALGAVWPFCKTRWLLFDWWQTLKWWNVSGLGTTDPTSELTQSRPGFRHTQYGSSVSREIKFRLWIRTFVADFQK